MGKSNKVAVKSRVDEVLRLLLAGAEFHDIQQVATTQNWQVSDRQLRRYVRYAYKRFEKASKRERAQLLGRHIAQRRALYAKALKAGDLRSALQIVRDEAALQGLYPKAGVPSVLEDPPKVLAGPAAIDARRRRLAKLIVAEQKGELDDRDLIERTAPKKYYTLPDTSMPNNMLQLMSLFYMTEQLEYAGMYFRFLFSSLFEETSENNMPHDIADMNAYLFRVNREGWERFTKELGIDSEALVRGNYKGSLMGLCSDGIVALAPSAEEMVEIFKRCGHESKVEEMKTAETHCKSWHNLLNLSLER